MKKNDYENKGRPSYEARMVSVKLCASNDVTGLGQPGSVVEVAEATALRLVRLGYAHIVALPAPPKAQVTENKEVA
jgi:hypothetical protein